MQLKDRYRNLVEQGAGGGNSDILQRQLEKANKELKVRRENGESWLRKE